MFKNSKFIKIDFENIPLNQDITIMDEKWAKEYESEWKKEFKGKESTPYSVGYISRVAARSIGDNWAELSWYVNTHDRFHEIPIFLPKSAFLSCICIDGYDENPTVFVKSEWIEDLHNRPLAAFAIIDAIGVKGRLQSGSLSPDSLRSLRRRVDKIAKRYENLAFISFADSLLIKHTLQAGNVTRKTRYNYSPEQIIPAIRALQRAIKKSLDLPSYAIMTQGLNSYEESKNIHTSKSGNHISLNTLGLPFAQLVSIEESARKAIKANDHPPAELYIDSTLFNSLKFKSYNEKEKFRHHPYISPMTHSHKSSYVPTSHKDLKTSTA